MSKKDNGITKEQYFNAASEYFRTQAEIIALDRCDKTSKEYAAKKSDLEREMFLKYCIMSDYCDTEKIDSRELLRYPRLSRDVAIREITANKALQSVKAEGLADVQYILSASLFAPMFLTVTEPNTYGILQLLLFSLLIIPGAYCMILLLSKAIKYPILRRVEKVNEEPLTVKEQFLRHIPFYKFSSCAAAVILGLLFYVLISL